LSLIRVICTDGDCDKRDLDCQALSLLIVIGCEKKRETQASASLPLSTFLVASLPLSTVLVCATGVVKPRGEDISSEVGEDNSNTVTIFFLRFCSFRLP
jgi:hypothetical protein